MNDVVAAPKLNRITVAEAVEEYMRGVDRGVRGRSLSPATARNYGRDLAEFIDIVGADTILDDLTGADIDDAVLAYGDRPDARFKDRPGRPEKTRGEGAMARFRQSVSRLFTDAVRHGWVEASPMPDTRVKPTARGKARAARLALPQDRAEALLAYAASTQARSHQRLALRDEFLLRLFMEAGPRVSEVCAANRGDLEYRDDTDWLRVLGKGRKVRYVPLSPETMAAYTRYLEHERPEPRPRVKVDPQTGERVEHVGVEDAEAALVLTWRGVRITPRDVQLMVKRAARRLPADLYRDVTPHGLRHTAATLLLSSGVADLHTVRDLLGHENIATTSVYADTTADLMAAAVRDHPVTGRRPRQAS